MANVPGKDEGNAVQQANNVNPSINCSTCHR